MHFLQKRLTKDAEVRRYAAWRVSRNSGAKTAGVDKVRNPGEIEREIMARNAKINGRTKAIKRVWIPKPGKNELRPLGIPTFGDRIKQMVALLALEPEWEMKMSEKSYGFRPKKNCHQAMRDLENLTKGGKYLIEGDIKKCFDMIDHDYLLGKMNTFPRMKRQVRA